jgi:hypothetical protein
MPRKSRAERDIEPYMQPAKAVPPQPASPSLTHTESGRAVA